MDNRVVGGIFLVVLLLLSYPTLKDEINTYATTNTTTNNVWTTLNNGLFQDIYAGATIFVAFMTLFFVFKS